MEKLKQEVKALVGIDLTQRQITAFDRYLQELLTWNARFNLTAIRDPETIRTKHFLDSLSCLLAFKEKPVTRLIDVGTGAGFPGIPIKIAIPSIQLTLVESVGKKADFCRQLVELLGLERVEVIQSRAEEVGQDPAHRERYDWGVARAVANMPTLSEYLLPLVKVGGKILFQKGENGPAEAHSSEKAARILGGQLHQVVPITIPGVAEERYLIVMNKLHATPPQYPRKVGIPLKKPIS